MLMPMISAAYSCVIGMIHELGNVSKDMHVACHNMYDN